MWGKSVDLANDRCDPGGHRLNGLALTFVAMTDSYVAAQIDECDNDKFPAIILWPSLALDHQERA